MSAAHEWMALDITARSPEDVMWAGHQTGGSASDEATSIEFALRGLAIHRHASEIAWPYGGPPWPAARPAAALRAEEQCSLPQWREIASPSFAAIRDPLSGGVAVLLSVRVVKQAWRQPDGVVDCAAGLPARAGHAVLAVGAIEDGQGERIIIKNSWGVLWGAAGYGFMTSRYLSAYLKRAYILEQS